MSVFPTWLRCNIGNLKKKKKKKKKKKICSGEKEGILLIISFHSPSKESFFSFPISYFIGVEGILCHIKYYVFCD